MGTHCDLPVVFRAVTTTFGPVVRLSEMRLEEVDHVMVSSFARLGVTVAPIVEMPVAPAPPVRIVAPLPDTAIR